MNKNEWTKDSRAKSATSDVQRAYDIFYTTGNNLKRKLKKYPRLLDKYNSYFKEIRQKAFSLKNSIFDDSLDVAIREYKATLRQMTSEVERVAEEFCEMGKDEEFTR